MILSKQFEENKYQSILQEEDAINRKLFIDILYDENNQIPEELVDIYISIHGDELFLILKGDYKDIHEMTTRWDEKISSFMVFGSDDRSVLKNLKYNVIQIILCSEEIVDRSVEGSLNVSRKLIFSYEVNEEGKIEIPDEEAVEIPFYLIPAGDFKLDEEISGKLSACLPLSNDLDFLYSPRKKEKNLKKGETSLSTMSFGETEYKIIEEWLKNAYSESRDN